MDKAEHGERLRVAMARKSLERQAVADFVEVAVRTITNWTSGKTEPSDGDKEKLRRLLGPYDMIGDPVETAVRQSSLVEWRQDAVISVYKRNLYEQAEGVTA